MRKGVSVDFDRVGLISLIRNEFKLDWHGIHGANHWGRVLSHGKMIGKIRKADLLVIELFGFMHDSCRLNDGRDPKHGERAAELAHGIQGKFYVLKPKQLDSLCYAMKHHSEGEMSVDTTIQTCWDSDRLDLGRIGITPSSKYLSRQASLYIGLASNWSISSGRRADNLRI